MLDKAYVTGIVDGEGWITICKQQNKPVTLRVCVGNTFLPLLEALKETYGGSIYSCGSQQRHTKQQRPVWHWCLNGKLCLPILQDTLPYLLIKKERAELALLFIDILGKRGPGEHPERQVKEDIATLMAELNAKGRGPLPILEDF